jgi:hypothetical protein
LTFRFAFLDSLPDIGAAGFVCGFAFSHCSPRATHLTILKPAGRVPPVLVLFRLCLLSTGPEFWLDRLTWEERVKKTPSPSSSKSVHFHEFDLF